MLIALLAFSLALLWAFELCVEAARDKLPEALHPVIGRMLAELAGVDDPGETHLSTWLAAFGVSQAALVLLLFLYHVASLGSLSAAPSPAVAPALLVLLSAGFIVVGTAPALPSTAAVAAGWETSRCARFYVTAALQAAGGAALLSQGTRAHGAALLCAVSVGVWPSLLQLTQLPPR